VLLLVGAANLFFAGELWAPPADFPQGVRVGYELVVALQIARGLGLARYGL
jgi:hypothetical protein